VRVGRDELGDPVIGLPVTDADGWMVLAQEAFGTVSPAFVMVEIRRMLNVLSGTKDGLRLEDKMNAAIAVVAGLQPRNEVEAVLAVQMALTHCTATSLLGRVQRAGDVMMLEHLAVYGKITSRLLRAFSAQMEVLAKTRRPGTQVIRVERIEVKDGSQALIGNVTAREGVSRELEHQPYGTEYARAVEPPAHPSMWGEKAGRDAMPESAGKRPKPLQTSRRRPSKRRAEG
jgi:hypothetical protein